MPKKLFFYEINDNNKQTLLIKKIGGGSLLQKQKMGLMKKSIFYEKVYLL